MEESLRDCDRQPRILLDNVIMTPPHSAVRPGSSANTMEPRTVAATDTEADVRCCCCIPYQRVSPTKALAAIADVEATERTCDEQSEQEKMLLSGAREDKEPLVASDFAGDPSSKHEAPGNPSYSSQVSGVLDCEKLQGGQMDSTEANDEEKKHSDDPPSPPRITLAIPEDTEDLDEGDTESFEDSLPRHQQLRKQLLKHRMASADDSSSSSDKEEASSRSKDGNEVEGSDDSPVASVRDPPVFGVEQLNRYKLAKTAQLKKGDSSESGEETAAQVEQRSQRPMAIPRYQSASDDTLDSGARSPSVDSEVVKARPVKHSVDGESTSTVASADSGHHRLHPERRHGHRHQNNQAPRMGLRPPRELRLPRPPPEPEDDDVFPTCGRSKPSPPPPTVEPPPPDDPPPPWETEEQNTVYIGGGLPGYTMYQQSLLGVPCPHDYGEASSDDLSSEWDSDTPLTDSTAADAQGTKVCHDLNTSQI
ncbi:histone-lysine N-methyltransferase SETD1B-like [Schistocerca serialis cubense]|uniref:histone-lysine N-methyltransferase SETD1B-like n=1 Tax=Schistocerca serialis cubense TaxID=2023355 RepID=UPI00214F326D|nr:histone-lysine N-methyltransferase SETD1B-like [Schistocerca serialis cubense]